LKHCFSVQELENSIIELDCSLSHANENITSLAEQNKELTTKIKELEKSMRNKERDYKLKESILKSRITTLENDNRKVFLALSRAPAKDTSIARENDNSKLAISKLTTLTDGNILAGTDALNDSISSTCPESESIEHCGTDQINMCLKNVSKFYPNNPNSNLVDELSGGTEIVRALHLVSATNSKAFTNKENDITQIFHIPLNALNRKVNLRPAKKSRARNSKFVFAIHSKVEPIQITELTSIVTPS